MARTSLTRDERDEMIRRLKAGGTVASVSDALGVRRNAIAKEKARRLRENDAATTYGSVVSVRLSPEETRALDALKPVVGTGSRSDVLRSLLRAGVGLLEFPPEQPARPAAGPPRLAPFDSADAASRLPPGVRPGSSATP